MNLKSPNRTVSERLARGLTAACVGAAFVAACSGIHPLRRSNVDRARPCQEASALRSPRTGRPTTARSAMVSRERRRLPTLQGPATLRPMRQRTPPSAPRPVVQTLRMRKATVILSGPTTPAPTRRFLRFTPIARGSVQHRTLVVRVLVVRVRLTSCAPTIMRCQAPLQSCPRTTS